MKIGSTVFAMHVAVLSVFALTQGCVTTESQGSGRGAGAKVRGPFKHEHKGKSVAQEGSAVAVNPYGAYEEEDTTSIYDEPMITESNSTFVEPSPVASSYGETQVYIVQKGDMLSQLAVDFDTTTASLVEINGLSNPDVLYVGQELRVPAGQGGSKTTSKPTGTIKKGGTYIIQKGDTLSGIALKADVAINDLRELNDIKGDKIMAGNELTIPAYGKVPSSSNKSTYTAKKAEPTPEPEVAPAAAPAAAPEPAAPVFETAEVAPAASSLEAGYYVVDEVMYPGDTLDIKAAQYGVTKAEIMRLNGITDESQVREGQTIRIPVAE